MLKESLVGTPQWLPAGAISTGFEKMKLSLVLGFSLASVIATAALADHQSLDAALGGALGGGAGAFVGNEIGGRSGAIVGGGLGGAAGAAVTTNSRRSAPQVDRKRRYRASEYDEAPSRHRRQFCPPGQAKKGNCYRVGVS